MTTYFKKIKSPAGPLTLVANDKNLLAVLWEAHDLKKIFRTELTQKDNHSVFAKTEKQLHEYFKGKRTEFDLPLEFNGTAFQKKVWKELEKIPFGKIKSYGELAVKIGNSAACRAVGGANGKNRLSIVVPCHRVIGSNGKLTGFAGGLKSKDFLLKHEMSVLEKM